MGAARQQTYSILVVLLWHVLTLSAPFLFAEAQSLDISSEIIRGPSSRKETACHYRERVQDGHYVNLHYNISIDTSSESGSRGLLVDTTIYKDTEADIDYDEPIMIRIGHTEQVFARWANYLIGLCAGDFVSLIVPPEHGYGNEGDGTGLVPAGATLKVDVEVLGSHNDHELAFKRSLAYHNADKMFEEMDQDKDGKISFDEMSGYLNVPDDYPNRESFLRQHFELSDYDKDGLVTLEEFKAIILNFQGIDDEPEL